MGKALQCDRCKKFGALPVFTAQGQPSWEQIGYIPERDEHVVVCPECAAEFAAFMKGAKVQE